MSLLTDRTFATGVTLNDLIHIVITGDTSQNPDGSSFKASIQQVFDSYTDVFVTGGTYNNATGKATFTNNTGGTFNVSGFYTGVSLSYGSFYSVLDQPIGSAGTTYTMSAETQSIASGVVLSNGGRYTLSNGGVYNIQFSAQLSKNTGTKSNVFIWFYKNGSNTPNSNTDITLDGAANDRVVASWNFVEIFNPGEYFEIRWTATQTNTFIDYVTSPLYGPEIPSVILTITQVV